MTVNDHGVLVGFTVASIDLDRTGRLEPSEHDLAEVTAREQCCDLISRQSRDGTLLWVSSSWKEVLGYEPRELLGTSALDLLHPDDAALLAEFAELVPSDPSEFPRLSTFDVRVRRNDDGYAWFETTIYPVSTPGTEKVVETICISRDVTHRRQVDEYAPVGIATMQLDGRIRHVNQALAGFLGRDASELVGQVVDDLTHSDDLVPDVELRSERIDDTTPAHLTERSFTRPDGQVAWGLVSKWLVSDARGWPCHIVSHIIDITERKHHEHELARQALYDPQTGLANRALFADHVVGALARIERAPASLAVLHIDIDDFKAVNDSFGYAAGDRVLSAIAERLSQAVRSVDTLARVTTLGRFGGDEFLVLCEGLSEDTAAMSIAGRIHTALKDPFTVESDQVVFLTASIGIATTSASNRDSDCLIRDAHTAVHRAKDRGGARFEIFEEALHRRALAYLDTASALQQAIEQDQLRLHYQPTVELATGRVVGAEALVRWEHPERGLLTAEEFIPIAERSSLIVALGDWVLREACRQAAAWRPHLDEHFLVSINLSPRDLERTELAEEVAGALVRAGVPTSMLCVEITETMMMRNHDSVLPGLHALAALGVVLAIDDFGTGYSSLAQLGEFPVDRIKIDRSFVRELGADRTREALVSAMIQMAHALGLSVVAEGIETNLQLATLQRLGCDIGQGYLLARPLTPGAFTIFTASERQLSSGGSVALAQSRGGQ